MGIFRQRMKELRESRGLTQQALGEALNIGKSAIALYETEKRHPDPDTLKRLAVFFNCSVDYLLGLTDEPQRQPPDHLADLPPEITSFVLDRKNHKLIRLIQIIKAQGYSNEVIEEWLVSLSNTLSLIHHTYQMKKNSGAADKLLVHELKEKYKDRRGGKE
ncbi:helix-turn-helix domain-containing protein [Desulforamulus putei]|uniref:Transcriptional regulator, contains XRE-family HTH domain n=1 Tax=Desulforamulus putei DSM 12395 TaxID=1121429 RepID=A0A1M4VCN0_9FIRM|nr:helix-turn-helix transcriptional regulator [Desulforamulus putei]SHE66742.1 Transcriptional regulator, contains XRE-family HTH domain [Desulforamulus putei DSM 12395]